MTTPMGICVSSVTGGGDCRRLLEVDSVCVVSWWPFSLSAVPGGVGSKVGWNPFALTEGVLRCLVKYDVDRGNSGRCECI
jgi:hypothetical protein